MTTFRYLIATSFEIYRNNNNKCSQKSHIISFYIYCYLRMLEVIVREYLYIEYCSLEYKIVNEK